MGGEEVPLARETHLTGRADRSTSSAGSSTAHFGVAGGAPRFADGQTASQGCAGLSTTVANERLIEEVELIVNKFLEHVKAVSWRSRLSFLQTHEGAVALLCCGVLAFVAAWTLDGKVFGEVLLVLPFHLAAWYISFRLPRVEQLRAIAKVKECLQRFQECDDVFTRSTRSDGGAAGGADEPEVVPPSSYCVGVLRDRAWRPIPYNMLVEGDVFKLRNGESFPCRAERLAVRPPYGALPTGEVHGTGAVFEPPALVEGGDASHVQAAPAVCLFRALSTACLPMVQQFLQSAQKHSEGRMDTFFHELEAVVRRRLKKVSFGAFLATATAFAAWLARPEVVEQGIEWHLHRMLLPFRLVICMMPLVPVILLQVTDVWGNARIQSLFEWHAGLADDEQEEGGEKPRVTEEASPGSGEIDASRVPIRRQLRELLDILRQGLDGPSNLMHTLNSTTVVSFCDKEGLLTDTCTTIAEICLCGSEHAGTRASPASPVVEAAPSRHAQGSSPQLAVAPASADEAFVADGATGQPSPSRAVPSSPQHGASHGTSSGNSGASPALVQGAGGTVSPSPSLDGGAGPSPTAFKLLCLDVQADPTVSCGLRFEDCDWRAHLPILKPLGLSMSVSRQPQANQQTQDTRESLYDLTVGDLLQASSEGKPHAAKSSPMHDCLCSMSQLIGFRDETVAAFPDLKFSMEFHRSAAEEEVFIKAPSGSSEAAASGARPPGASEESHSQTEASPNFVAQHARPHRAWRAVISSPGSHASSASSPSLDTEEAIRMREKENAIQQQNSRSSKDRSIGSDELSQSQDESYRSAHTGSRAINFSQTLMTWFVQDTRDNTLQMFCKAKPKRLLTKCTHRFDGARVVPLSEEDKQALQGLVLQWKASGLSAVAFSYRPLTSQAEIDIVNELPKHSFFCATQSPEGVQTTAEICRVCDVDPGHQAGCPPTLIKIPSAGGDAVTELPLPTALAELQGEQVLLGMAGVKLCAAKQTTSYAEALQGAGIRFQVYSTEGEKRTRTLGNHLGLETGWNCLINLEPGAVERKNMMGQVVLPTGISNIRKHIKQIDNVPLLVSLYSNATPWRVQQMVSILQENAECVTCVGSALRPNFETFRQANISVSVLVGAVPQCRRCFGRREPRPGEPDSNQDLLTSTTVNTAEFQLSADLTSLPCALQARHSYSNGEQRTLGVLFNAIKEARRCVDCILMVLIHFICGALQLAVIVAMQALLCLPPPLEGIHMLTVLFVLLPVLSVALLFNAASPQLMKELPLKKADEKTLAQPGRLMTLYALRSVPTALVVIAAFVHDLHRLFEWQVQEARRLPSWSTQYEQDCSGVAVWWWLSGRWPRCVAAMQKLATSAATSMPDTGISVLEPSCALAHAQQWSASLFMIYEVTLAFTFLDRYDSLLKRGPTSNKVLLCAAAVALLVHLVVSWVVVFLSCGRRWNDILTPTWDVWVIYVALWPCFAVVVSEGAKRRDRKYHSRLQRTLRVLFNTRLGMWSPR